MAKERPNRLALVVKGRDVNDLLSEIRNAYDPANAADIIANYDIEEAVAIIDNLDQLTAAFMMTVFRFRIQAESGFKYRYAKELVERADELHIRGTAGLCYARDIVYRETGFFAGT
jgi:hypothetical protein